jgi:hypothetical protein
MSMRACPCIDLNSWIFLGAGGSLHTDHGPLRAGTLLGQTDRGAHGLQSLRPAMRGAIGALPQPWVPVHCAGNCTGNWLSTSVFPAAAAIAAVPTAGAPNEWCLHLRSQQHIRGDGEQAGAKYPTPPFHSLSPPRFCLMIWQDRGPNIGS